jgi:hypothetical protein
MQYTKINIYLGKGRKNIPDYEFFILWVLILGWVYIIFIMLIVHVLFHENKVIHQVKLFEADVSFRTQLFYTVEFSLDMHHTFLFSRFLSPWGLSDT